MLRKRSKFFMYSLPQKNLVKCQNPCHNLMHEIEIQVILVYTTISFIHTEIYTVKYYCLCL